MKLKLIVIGFILFGNSSLFGQENSRSYSLQEAIDFSIENNVDVLNANLDIDRAKKEVWKTTAIGLPQANANLDYQHLPGDLPSLEFPGPDGPQQIRLGVKNSSTYSVTVSQLVFSGEYIVGLQAAKTFLQLSENGFEKSKQMAKSSISSAYYTILLLENSKAILDSSLSNNDLVVSETKAMAEIGLLEETDYEQFSIVNNTLKNGVKSIERQIELAYRLFKINLGLSDDVEVELTQTIDELIQEVEFATLLSNEFFLENNVDYKMLMTNEKISELTVRREKTKFLPTLSAFYLYQDKTNKADFDVTFNHILGLSLNFPIFSSGQRIASLGQSKIDLEKNKNLKTQTGQSLIMAVDQARGDFQTAYESYETQASNIELAKKIYDQTLIKYKEGVSSSLEVTQTHDQYLNAFSSYNSAILEVLNAKTSLEIILSK